MTAEGAGTDTGQNSREPRVGKMILAQMHSARLPEHDVVIRNVSRHGLCIRSKADLPLAGEKVTITLQAFGEYQGVIRWVHRTNFGVRLNGELDPTKFQFAGKSWDIANRAVDQGHVLEHFKAVANTYRPALKPR